MSYLEEDVGNKSSSTFTFSFSPVFRFCTSFYPVPDPLHPFPLLPVSPPVSLLFTVLGRGSHRLRVDLCPLGTEVDTREVSPVDL